MVQTRPDYIIPVPSVSVFFHVIRIRSFYKKNDGQRMAGAWRAVEIGDGVTLHIGRRGHSQCDIQGVVGTRGRVVVVTSEPWGSL